jgi:putative ABC transport system permease protein
MYNIDNLTELIAVANKTTNDLTLVLFLIAVITLIVGGIGIMNIMQATVNTRIHEIGIRKALGASKLAILLQFLAESFLISAAGVVAGIGLGLGLPVAVRLFTDYHIGISGLSVMVGFVVPSLVGILFGVVPASRAAHLNPVQSPRSE